MQGALIKSDLNLWKSVRGRIKLVCREQKFIAAINWHDTSFFIIWGLNVLSLNLTASDTIVGVIQIKKTYGKSQVSTNLLASLSLIFSV